MKLIYLFLITNLLCACTNDDKHPNIPMFEERLLEGIDYEKVDYSSYYLGNTDRFLFFKHSESVPQNTDSIKVVSVKDRRLIRSIPSNSRTFINENGVIYMESEGRFFKYAPPLFKKKTVPFIVLEHPSRTALETQYKQEIKDLNYKASNAFIDNKIDEFVTKKHLKNIKHTYRLHDFNYVFKGENREFVARCNFLDKKQIFIERKKIYDFKDIKNLRYSPKDNSIKNKHLEKFDEVVLRYKLTGQNHFVFGIHKEKLRYYNLTLGNKKIQFKTSVAEEFRDYQGNVLLSVDDAIYKIKDKTADAQ